LGNFARADDYLQRLVVLYNPPIPNHIEQASAIQLKGRFLLQRGQYDAAHQLFQETEQVLRKTGESPQRAELLHEWQRLYLLRSLPSEAVDAMQIAIRISESELRRLLVQGSERERLQMLKLYSDETAEALALHAVSVPHSAAALELAFTTWLQRKGRALDEMNKTLAHIRNSADQESAVLLKQLIDKYSQVSLLKTRPPAEKDLAQHQQRLTQLQQETEQLEVTLSQRNARFRTQIQPVTLDAVRQALPAGSALVEFARFNPKDVKTQEPLGEQYVAYVLLADGTLRWAALGAATEIETATREWLEALGKADASVSGTTLKRLARRVDKLVMQPVRAQLGDTRQVLLAPDGLLNLIPFAALVDERDRELVRDYQFVYLTSGRDLLRLQIKHQSTNDVVVFAAPDYEDTSGVTSVETVAEVTMVAQTATNGAGV
jgi:tetratricopeptide (TPR) repeat protein